MKNINIDALEEIDLEGWDLISDTPTAKIYHKFQKEKRLEIYEEHTLEINLIDGEYHGNTIGRMHKTFLHYPNYKSKIYLIENYLKGKLNGVSFNFYDDGSKSQQQWINDQAHGNWEAWFSNGQKELEKNFSHGKLDGKQYEWYENGQLKTEQTFSHGIQIGECLKYLENGRLKRKQFYKKGKIEGMVYELWDYKGKVVDGGLYSESEYKKNIQHGPEVVYYPSTQKMREGNYQNGNIEGERIWWNINGTISIKEYYKNGELDGKRFIYNENGELERVQHYKNGDLIS